MCVVCRSYDEVEGSGLIKDVEAEYGKSVLGAFRGNLGAASGVLALADC